MKRRSVLQSALAAATLGAAVAPPSLDAAPRNAEIAPSTRACADNLVQARDGTRLYWQQWGTGRPMVFIHSWGLDADMWQYQFAALAERGLRCIAYDRRGHGRSGTPSHGYDYDTLADDAHALIEALDLRDVTLVGHSMGCGEVVRYVTRHGTARVRRIALLSTVTPRLQASDDNPDGIPAAVFAALRDAWRDDFPQWLSANTAPFFTSTTSPAMMQWVTSMLLRTSLPVLLECSRQYSATDFRAELRTITLPALVVHGDADASAPLALTGQKTAALLRQCEFAVYQGAPHGLFLTHKQRLNTDLLRFVGG